MYVVVDEVFCILDWGYEFWFIFCDIKYLCVVRLDVRFLVLLVIVLINGISDIIKFFGMENL